MQHAEVISPTRLLIPFIRLGKSVILLTQALQGLHNIKRKDFVRYSIWMGVRSFALVSFSAMAVGMALTLQTVTELRQFGAENFSGTLISLGLLRELGPITVSIAWNVRVAALLGDESYRFRKYYDSDESFAKQYIPVRFAAALMNGTAMGAYGLVIGFITADLGSPFFGIDSVTDFLNSAKEIVQARDIVVYMVKIVLVNPVIAVFASCTAGLFAARRGTSTAAADAVTLTFLWCFIGNFLVTFAAYYSGG